MLSNWADYLLQYNFTVVHCPGVLNVLPDYLSRMFSGSNKTVSGAVEVNMEVTIIEKLLEKVVQSLDG